MHRVAMLRKQRQRELCAHYKARQREEFRTVGLDKIEEMLIEDGGLPSQDESEGGDDSQDEEVPEEPSVANEQEAGKTKRKKRKFESEAVENKVRDPRDLLSLTRF